MVDEMYLNLNMVKFNRVDYDYNGLIVSEIYTQSSADLDGSITYDLSFSFSKSISTQLETTRTISFGLKFLADQYDQHSGYLQVVKNQTLTNPVELTGLNSEYNASWLNPFIGISEQWHTGRQNITLGFSLYAAAYYAECLWNLRRDLAQPRSFLQKGLGGGVNVKGTHSWQISKNTALEQSLKYGYLTTFSGEEKMKCFVQMVVVV